MRTLRDRLFRRRSLERVVEPTRVRLEGTIETEDAPLSPVTGASGALLRWTLFEPMPDPLAVRDVRPLFSGLLAAAGRGLLVKVGPRTLEIPLEGIDLRLPIVPDDAVRILHEIPATLADAIPASAVAVPLLYRERLVAHGARVRLLATVSVPCRGVGSPYRASPRIDFTAHGRVRLDVLG